MVSSVTNRDTRRLTLVVIELRTRVLPLVDVAITTVVDAVSGSLLADSEGLYVDVDVDVDVSEVVA